MTMTTGMYGIVYICTICLHGIYAVIYDERAEWNVHACVWYRPTEHLTDAWVPYPQTNEQQQIKTSLYMERRSESPPI